MWQTLTMASLSATRNSPQWGKHNSLTTVSTVYWTRWACMLNLLRDKESEGCNAKEKLTTCQPTLLIIMNHANKNTSHAITVCRGLEPKRKLNTAKMPTWHNDTWDPVIFLFQCKTEQLGIKVTYCFIVSSSSYIPTIDLEKKNIQNQYSDLAYFVDCKFTAKHDNKLNTIKQSS